MISQLCRRFARILAVTAVLPAAPAFAIAIRDSQQGLPEVDEPDEADNTRGTTFKS